MIPDPDHKYETTDFQFAAFLIATRTLKVLGWRDAGGQCLFIFADPDGQGDSLLAEFDCGAPASARNLFAAQKRLRKMLDEWREAAR